jgi:hypothetical protein
LNARIEAFNRHYPFERQCALRYVPLDAPGFTPRPRISPEDLRERFAPLPVP